MLTRLELPKRLKLKTKRPLLSLDQRRKPWSASRKLMLTKSNKNKKLTMNLKSLDWMPKPDLMLLRTRPQLLSRKLVQKAINNLTWMHKESINKKWSSALLWRLWVKREIWFSQDRVERPCWTTSTNALIKSLNEKEINESYIKFWSNVMNLNEYFRCL